MKIFTTFSVYEVYFREVYSRLKKRNPELEFGGIVYGRAGYRNLLQKPFPWGQIDVFTDYLRKHYPSREPDMAYLEAKEKTLGIPNLPFYIASDRALSRLPAQRALRMLELTIRFTEDCLARFQPDLIVMDDVSCMMSYLIHTMGRNQKIPVWSIGTVKLEDRISFYDDCLDKRKKIETAYEKLKNTPLTQAQRDLAESYRREYVENFRPPSYLEYKGKVPTLSWEYAKRFARLLRDYLSDPYDITRMSLSEILTRRISRVLRYQLGKVTRLFSDPVEGEKFVYFPLQAQPERTTLILAPFYLDQVALLSNIAKSLPIGYRLYVKDHPIFLGRRPLAEYRRIRDVFNVRLIRTEHPSQDLVRRSEAVVTISNTVGIEAILFEKPLLVLGNTFYNSYRNLTAVDNQKDLPQKTLQTLADFRPDREELLKWITAVLQGSHEGTRRHPLLVPEVMSERNLDKVSAAFAQELEEEFGLKSCAVSSAS